MKSLLLLTTAALLSGTVLAQKPGSALVYGTIGYTSNKSSTDLNAGNGTISTNTERYHQFGTNLGIGYQLTPHWTLGVTAGLSASKNRGSDLGTGLGSPIDRFTGFSVGPFARYTQRFGGAFFGFGQLEAAYLGGRTTQEYSGSVLRNEVYNNGFYAQLYPAFGIQVTRRTALAFNFGGIGYTYSEADRDGGVVTNTVTTSNSSFAATFGSQANLTVQWSFGDGHHGPSRRFRRMRGPRRELMQDTRRMRDYEDDEEETTEAPRPSKERRPAPRPRRDRYDD